VSPVQNDAEHERYTTPKDRAQRATVHLSIHRACHLIECRTGHLFDMLIDDLGATIFRVVPYLVYSHWEGVNDDPKRYELGVLLPGRF